MTLSVPAGLCETCRHVFVTLNDRGSRFIRCEYSKEDARYPKYPRLPVLRCPAYRQADPPPASET